MTRLEALDTSIGKQQAKAQAVLRGGHGKKRHDVILKAGVCRRPEESAFCFHRAREKRILRFAQNDIIGSFFNNHSEA